MKSIIDALKGKTSIQPFKEYPNPKENKQHLEWIYNRLIEIHNENPNYDYMLKFKEIIENYGNIR
jgi:hypothetical protein